MIRKILIVIVGISIWGGMPLLSMAQEKTFRPETIFMQANAAYEHGSYDEALSLYQSLISGTHISAAVYFNMGNCYIKKGEIGRAILFYERARRLAPRDGDIKANYRYAKSQLTEIAPPEGKEWITYSITRLFEAYTINEITILLSVVYCGAFGLLIGVQKMKGTVLWRKGCAALGVLVLVGTFVAVALSNRIMMLDKEAIVLSNEVSATFEPIEQSTTHFTLYEGMKVLVRQERGDWVKVERADTKMGWIKKETIETVSFKTP